MSSIGEETAMWHPNALNEIKCIVNALSESSQ